MPLTCWLVLFRGTHLSKRILYGDRFLPKDSNQKGYYSMFARSFMYIRFLSFIFSVDNSKTSIMKLKRILLVEDDMEDQYLFNHALDCLQVSAFCKAVANGQEALDHLSHSAEYELIFLDLNMPLMDGLSCLKLIRQNEKFKSIPVVIITTSVNPFELNLCTELGVASIFHKPNTFPELCNGLHTILMN
jgi:CheY-like chemotaxis protein